MVHCSLSSTYNNDWDMTGAQHMLIECMNECEACKGPMGVVMKITPTHRSRRGNTIARSQTACREGCAATAAVLISLNRVPCPTLLASPVLQPGEWAIGVHPYGSLTGNWRLQPASSTCLTGVARPLLPSSRPRGTLVQSCLHLSWMARYFDCQLELRPLRSLGQR